MYIKFLYKVKALLTLRTDIWGIVNEYNYQRIQARNQQMG